MGDVSRGLSESARQMLRSAPHPGTGFYPNRRHRLHHTSCAGAALDERRGGTAAQRQRSSGAESGRKGVGGAANGVVMSAKSCGGGRMKEQV